MAEDLLPAWWAEAGDVFPAEYGIPAAYAPDYVFSDTPRGAHEQWIFDNYPQHWEAGVRAMSPIINWFPWGWDGMPDFARDENGRPILNEHGYPVEVIYPDPGPAPLVQFYDGVRYDGTPMLPLAFGKADPTKPPSEYLGHKKSLLYRVDANAVLKKIGIYTPNSGQGERNPFTPLMQKDGSPVPTIRVYSVDDIVENLKDGKFIVPGKDVPENQWRKLLPGEVLIKVHDFSLPLDGVRWDVAKDRLYILKTECDAHPEYYDQYPDLCANQP